MTTNDATAATTIKDPEGGWGWLGIKGLYTQYMWVWLGLLIFTAIEVVIPEPATFGLSITFSRLFVVVSLILIALVKTWMVAWYYMHLIAERPAIILVACVPFIFSLFLTIGMFPWTF